MNRSDKSANRSQNEADCTKKHRGRSQNTSRREIENLMGMHDSTYERHNHALRRKGR